MTAHFRHLLLTIFCGLLFFFSGSVYAAGNCSPFAGQASLNEFFKDRANQANDGDDFLEVKILNPAITDSIFNNWSVLVCEELEGGTQNDTDDCTPTAIPLSDFDTSTTPWKVLEDGNIGKYINFKTGFEAILLDHNNDVIDYVSVSIDGTPQLEEANCLGTDLPFPYLAGAPGASDKYIFRTPDGTGPWDSAASGADDGTEEDTNDVPPGGGTYPVVTVSDVTVTKGTTATFTLTLDKSIDDPVVIFYETLGGTAVPSTSSPSDYTYTKSSVTFPANTTTLSLNVNIATEGVSPASSGEVFFYLYIYMEENPPTSYANATIQNAYPKGTILGTTSQTIVLSTGQTRTLDSLNFTNGSLVEYDPLSSPAALYFSETKFDDDENISAAHVLDNGNIVISTGNSATLGGLTFRDGDLAEYNPTTDIATLYFDQDTFSSAVDISAVYIKDNDNIILSTTSDAVLKGVNIRNGDLVEYNPNNDTASIFFNQDEFSDPNVSIDGVHVLDSGNILMSMTIGATLAGYTFRDGDIIEYNPTTKIASLYFDQNLFTQAGADINALTLPKPISSSIDHFEIWHDGSGLTCEPETIKVRACTDNASPCTLYTSDVTVTLSPAEGATTNWLPNPQVITASTVTDLTLAYKTLSPAGATFEDVTLNIESPSYSTVCKDLTGNPSSCDIRFYNSGFVYDIPTHTSCETSTTAITIRAVRKDNTTQQCVPAFRDKDRTLKVWASYTDPAPAAITGSPAVTLVNDNGTYPLTSTEATAVDVNMSFIDTAGDNYETFTINYPDAGQLTLNTKYEGSVANSDTGLTMLGNTTFVVKPAKFYVYSDDANASCPSADPANADCEVAFRKTGENFNLKVRAACADNTVTPNFKLNGIGINSNLIAPSGGTTVNANIAVNSVDITTSGEAIIANQNVDQVGVFTFTASMPAAPTTYLGETVIGTTALNTSSNIGRFTPDHFDTLVTHGCTGGSNFTYSGQPFTVTATARNHNNTALVNYRGSFAGVTITDAFPAATPLGTFTNDTIPGVNFTSTGTGSGTINNITYTFTDKETIPETLEIRATDLNKTASTTDDINSSGFTEGTTEIRSGRTRLNNAYGSELVDMAVPAQVEYFDGIDFAINTSDTCSTITVTLTDIGSDAITLGDGSIAGNTCIWDDDAESGSDNCSDASLLPGLASNQFQEAAPLAGSFNLFLKAPGENFTGDIGITLTSPTWLQFDWDGNGNHDNDPNGVASFGLYRGDDRIIYQREVF